MRLTLMLYLFVRDFFRVYRQQLCVSFLVHRSQSGLDKKYRAISRLPGKVIYFLQGKTSFEKYLESLGESINLTSQRSCESYSARSRSSFTVIPDYDHSFRTFLVYHPWSETLSKTHTNPLSLLPSSSSSSSKQKKERK